MASAAPGSSASAGLPKIAKSLPLGDLKILFFQFLEQQGYAVPAEVDNIIKAVTPNANRDSSPSPSVCSSGKRSSSAISSDEQTDDTVKGSNGESDSSFKIVKRKHKKAARRQRINSNSDSNESAMEVETSRANHRDAGNNNATKTTAAAPKQATVAPKPIAANGAKPTPPPKVKPPPPICLRDKSKWNTVSSECTRMHINYSRAQNTSQGIKIITNTIEDFRKLNSYLIKSNIPFHTFALEEERKIKAVIKGVPIEIETEAVKEDLKRQGYSVTAVHRMHRRDGTALGLAILERCDQARDIFKNLYNVCGLSGIKAEAPYQRGMPGQCHRCQLYGHAAANCYAQPRCVKCLVPHWTRDCDRNKESGGEPSCCNCGQNHTANYGGCPVAPKPKVVNNKNRKQSAPKARPAPPRGEPMEDAASMDETANNKRDKHQGVSATNIAPRGNRGVRTRRGHYHNNVHPTGGQERRGFRPSSQI
ncbi:Nucleic-acid-binding protein from transposon X-element [Eumeta japonica]|uniref:Nucleic-acid-binding protein from transposon X-element n=1 Tax=Eumeta variegata TaxID=151549 RepID=A0A4C1Z973_EUMVA|nr:Nucleic-acid-binding protein from transposon X-element [Eumeta japonica]